LPEPAGLVTVDHEALGTAYRDLPWDYGKSLQLLCVERQERTDAGVGSRGPQYEPLLLDNERDAVADLLQYLESTCARRPC